MTRLLFLLAAALLAQMTHAQAVKAPSFDRLPDDARIVLMPLDVELFTLGAGGMPEPQAQWTSQALGHMRASLQKRESGLGQTLVEDGATEPRSIALNHLHGAVAGAIALRHYLALYTLPTKGASLDWNIGADTTWLREQSGADYALFIYVRDSYATAERKAAIILAAMLGVGLPGGFQVGYASLADLRSGRIVWFNRLIRGAGDLREAEPAEESINALLQDFPR